MSHQRGQQSLKPRRHVSKKKTLDEDKEINVAVKTGEMLIGSKKVISELSIGNLKMIILANNTPDNIVQKISILNRCLEEKVPVYTSDKSSWALGAACGKPYWIASLGVLDEGDSSIMQLISTEA